MKYECPELPTTDYAWRVCPPHRRNISRQIDPDMFQKWLDLRPVHGTSLAARLCGSGLAESSFQYYAQKHGLTIPPIPAGRKRKGVDRG